MHQPIKGFSFTPPELVEAARQDRRKLRCGTTKQLAKFVKNRLREALNGGAISREELAKCVASLETLHREGKPGVSNAIFDAIETLYQETPACPEGA